MRQRLPTSWLNNPRTLGGVHSNAPQYWQQYEIEITVYNLHKLFVNIFWHAFFVDYYV